MDSTDARDRARTLIASGAAPAELLPRLDRVLADADWDDELFAYVGVYASNHDELDRAVGYFENAIDLDPSYPRYHYDLGVAHARAERYAAARPAFEQALVLLPHMTYGLFNLAWCYVMSDDLVAAAFAMDRVHSLYAGGDMPENMRYVLSEIYDWLVSDLKNPSPPTLLNRGLGHWGHDDFAGADRHLTRLARLLPAGTAGWAVAEESAVTARYHLDLHAEFVSGRHRRRAAVPCVSALVPDVVMPNLAVASVDTDVVAAANRLVAGLDPDHDPDQPILVEFGPELRGGRGSRARTVLVGSYRVVTIGNIIRITGDDGSTTEHHDWTGTYTALCTV
ncbi:tetratricopeptide repeat protein [Streptomyces sp. NPDC059989]|uniref:tetratricopeptide repeat protein n=1 Tax=Streptomyces sp. NPDC059989 TaxID=3347026 RepID=UPI0036B5DA6A